MWVMTAAYLSLAELVDDGEIGADGAASIMAMLADGIVSQVPLSAAAATWGGTDKNVSRNPIGS